MTKLFSYARSLLSQLWGDMSW